MNVFQLNFVSSGFCGIFGVLSVLSWITVLLYSKDYMKKDKKKLRFYVFLILTLFAALGVFFAADFYTLFVCFEIMSLTSFVWVAHRQTKQALYASGTYLGIGIAGGLAILMGIFLLYHSFGTVRFSELSYAIASSEQEKQTLLYVAAVCLFAGFGAKAGVFGLHVWLPDSYTEAPAPSTALLSAILSKTGIYGILLLTASLLFGDENWGMFLLVMGVVTMVYGGLRGVLSCNLKTTVAYSSMSQIGFILIGVGMYGLSGSLGGTLLHMVNHTLVKLVLFLLCGVIFVQTGSYELNEVRGFGRGKRFLQICFVLAAAGVGGIPLFNGYISKTLLHESIAEYYHMTGMPLIKATEALFLISGGLTIAYMTKLYVVLFVQKNKSEETQKKYEQKKDYMTIWEKAAVALCALPIPLLGLFPHQTADKLINYGTDSVMERIPYFSLTNLSGALLSIAAGALIYVVFVRLLMVKDDTYRSIWPNWLSMEKYLYRAVFYRAIPFIVCVLARILDSILDWIVVLLRRTVYCDRRIPHELTEGNIITHEVGVFMEFAHKLSSRARHKKYEEGSYEHKAALRSEDIIENLRIIERSLSFGLFMFCMGLGLTMIYLLVVGR